MFTPPSQLHYLPRGYTITIYPWSSGGNGRPGIKGSVAGTGRSLGGHGQLGTERWSAVEETLLESIGTTFFALRQSLILEVLFTFQLLVRGFGGQLRGGKSSLAGWCRWDFPKHIKRRGQGVARKWKKKGRCRKGRGDKESCRDTSGEGRQRRHWFEFTVRNEGTAVRFE